MKIYLTLFILPVFSGIYAQEETSPEPPAPPKGEAAKVTSTKPFNPEMDIVDFPDVETEFPGGMKAMQLFIQENIIYPEEAREKGEQGRVYVTFIVERDGSVSTIDVMRGGVTPSINAEAIRVVAAMPKWTPGEMGGLLVRTRCRLPITFTLVGSEEDEVPKKKRLFRRR